MKSSVYTEKAPKPIGPYSQAIKAGGFLFISGQVPVNPATGKVDDTDIKHQTKQVMENLRAILTEAGLSFENVVKSTIFITDMGNFPLINEVYGSYFNETPPARETVQVCKLPLGVDVEISMIAVY